MGKPKFYDRPIERKHRRVRQVRGILRELDIQFRILWRVDPSGYAGMAFPSQSQVVIYAQDLSIRDFLSTAFHEIAHVLNFRDRKFVTYHSYSKRPSKRDLRNWIRTGLRAERYTEKRGRKLMARYFRGIPYKDTYWGENEIEWFHQHVMARWKRKLARR
jgi:hypothetical protein